MTQSGPSAFIRYRFYGCGLHTLGVQQQGFPQRLSCCLVYVLIERVGKAFDVLPVEVGGRLVKRQNATVKTERLGERQADDQRRQNLFTSTVQSHGERQAEDQ